MRRLEWKNRMLLEAYKKPYKPLFVTATYRDEDLPDNVAECIQLAQKWLKRIRKNYGPGLRYFCATERGTKHGRLHQHYVLWHPEVCRMDLVGQWKALYETWTHGRLQSEPIRGIGGLAYVAKYICKNLVDSNTKGVLISESKWNRRAGQYQNPGRLFTYSNRPAFGADGYMQWEKSIATWKPQNGAPPNSLMLPIWNSLVRVYIPKDAYMRTVKALGYRVTPEKTTWQDPQEEREKLQQWEANRLRSVLEI